MKQTFRYRPRLKTIAKLAAFLLVPVMMVVVPIVEPFDFVIAGKTVVAYPGTIYVFGFMALVALFFILWMLNSALKERSLNGGEITVEDGMVHYKRVEKGVAKDVSFAIGDIVKSEQASEDESVHFVVTTSDSVRHVFNEKYFDNEDAFMRFRSAIRKWK